MQERPLGVVLVAILVFGMGALPASVAAMRARAERRTPRAHVRLRTAQPEAREKFEERRVDRRATDPAPCYCPQAPCKCPPAR